MKHLPMMPSEWWVRPAHLMLGSLVVAVAALPAVDALSLSRVALLAVVTGGFLSWQGSTIGLTWAWTTLLLGLESLAWPFVTI